MFFAIFFWCIFLQIDQPISQPRNSITHSIPYPSSSSSSSIHSESEYSSSTTSDEYYFRQSLRSAKSNFLNDDFFWHVHRSLSLANFTSVFPFLSSHTNTYIYFKWFLKSMKKKNLYFPNETKITFKPINKKLRSFDSSSNDDVGFWIKFCGIKYLTLYWYAN